MPEPIALVTGACGLVGSDACLHFSRNGFRVVGIDDNHRAVFFGPEGDTRWTLDRLRKEVPAYRHESLDIRDRQGLTALVREIRPDLILHAAGQPSHDRAAGIPLLDFEVNALGTLNLLEAARQYCPETPLVYMSTNKVYGDSPNRLPLEETETRWDYAGRATRPGDCARNLSIDQCMHSVFGASKTAADVMVQEYGRYLQSAYVLSAGRLYHRSQPCGRGTARVPQLSGQVQSRRPRVQSLRLQGQSRSGTTSIPRTWRASCWSSESAARRRGI